MPSTLPPFGGGPMASFPPHYDMTVSALNEHATVLLALRSEVALVLITSVAYSYGLSKSQLDQVWRYAQDVGAGLTPGLGASRPSVLIDQVEVICRRVLDEDKAAEE